MEPNWEHIKREISSKEAPLSADAWENMNGLLEANAPKKKALYWWLLVPALLLLTVPMYLLTQNNEAPEIPEAEINTTIGVNKIESKSTPNAIKNNKVLNDENVEKSVNAVLPKVLEEVVPQKTAGSKKAIAGAITTNTTVNNPQKFKETLNEKLEVETVYTAEKEETVAAIASDSTASFYEEETLLAETSMADSMQVPRSEKLLNKNSNKGLWELKVYAGPTYNMPNIQYNSVADFTNKEYASATNNSVKQGWGFDAGLEISYFIAPHFKLSTGIAYREIVTNNSMNYSVGEVPVIDSATRRILGYITLPQAVQQSSSSQNSFVYVGVPVSLFKEIPLRGRFSLTAEFANTFSFLIKQHSEEINPTTLQIEGANDDIFNPLLVNYQLRLGLRYRINQSILLALEPAYRGTYNNMYNSDYISWKPRDFSLNAAIIIQLRKK